MLVEERLKVIESLSMALRENDQEVRRGALNALVRMEMDGLYCIIDAAENDSLGQDMRKDALHALGQAFVEGYVDGGPIIKEALKALEKMLESSNDVLLEQAVDTLGHMGPRAIELKPKLLGLLDSESANKRLCVRVAAALLQISPN